MSNPIRSSNVKPLKAGETVTSKGDLQESETPSGEVRRHAVHSPLEMEGEGTHASEINTKKVEFGPEKPKWWDRGPSATRNDLQLGRRIFHFVNGATVATAYGFWFTHQETVYVLGTLACVAYVFEKIRIAYPELLKRASWFTNLFLRAEEQVKESAMIPYAMAILLSLITFPKTVALVAIYTLAIADPLAAIVGITYGKHKLVEHKTAEGSAAFFFAALLCAFTVLFLMSGATVWPVLAVATLVALSATFFEMIPLRIDDNITIPLFVGFSTWIWCALFAIPV